MSLQTRLAALITAIGADIKALYAGKVDKTTITAAGAALLDDADAAAQRTTLGLGTAAITNTGTGATDTILGNDTRLSDARTPIAHTHTTDNITGLATALSGKQGTLVSGTNIKTINGASVLGSGNLEVGSSGAGGGHEQSFLLMGA